MVVIKGNYVWIIPLLIIIATASVTLYIIYPVNEYFTMENMDKEDSDNDSVNSDKKDSDNESVNSDNDLEEILRLKKKIKELENKKNKNKKNEKNEMKMKVTKENFRSFSNSVNNSMDSSVGVLGKNWRKENIPSPLKRYNGQIQGYNCGKYSSNFTNFSCPTNPGDPTSNDYIFPGKKTNRSGIIKYASRPHLLEHEDDVNQKILEYESTNVYPNKIDAHKVKHLEYPQYMYHRRSGKKDSIITDANRFNAGNGIPTEIGSLNVFKKKTPEYSVI